MTTTSFSESFKYASRLFGLFLVIVLFGGGLLGVGAVLAVPEIQAWRGPEVAETEIIAGGLVLAVLGLSVLIIGQFAIVYKLIADGVSKGNAEPTADLAAGSTDSADAAAPAEETESEEPERAPAEREPATADAAGQPTESVEQQPPQEPEQPAEPQPATEPEPAAREEQPPAGAGPADQQPAQAAREQPEQDDGEGTGREQTAEEIVFGSSDESAEKTTEAETAESTGEEEFDEDEQRSRENVETAGNSGSDPLADNFDEE